MKAFFERSESAVSGRTTTAVESIYTQPSVEAAQPSPAPRARVSTPPISVSSEARIAVYDSLTSAPRVELVPPADANSFIEVLAARVFHLAKEAGGSIPYMVVRELAENYIHAGFREVVVTILDSGDTIRFSDQGPGITDKERCFSPGFTTASGDMKRVIRGVGSGLPIARECLQFSGGTICIEDNLLGGTVVTIAVEKAAPAHKEFASGPAQATPRLSTRQKRVLSLAVELGSLGPSVVAKELGVALSTAYRDLASLEELGILDGSNSGKRMLTPHAVESLDQLLGL